MKLKALKKLFFAQDWVFDLDNTLYPAECDLFAQMDVRMTEFVGRYLDLDYDAAKAKQKDLYMTYGTTLNGMMHEHDMPAAAFLDYVHDLDYSPVVPAPKLRTAISALPGRKLVFTNGSRGHAQRTLNALGLENIFHDVFDIEATGYVPKPKREAFEVLIERHMVEPSKAVMVEDMSPNLLTAHELGFSTILVWSWKDWSHEPALGRPAGPVDETPDHVHHATCDLTAFLEAVVAAGQAN
ncbi:pyrimidine 5'-nucleotidase [Candidatus Phycosocius spiralis]|uniref:Pyrimidine 5'-nucleotidase n=1 Tax=Candidatus Phycosocius spiralis TaxID=2815099 RepID=A0ABQ4PX46_9PROT|nr:pyrimidine 5'-nucleotidase [Candidatus Phycosocius spiralis]GIU67631.1 pyrimidine 5'-nucleotidase [Candidatus Phycosocius spiralis]